MSNLKILAVDDSPTMRRIIVNTLKRAGYEGGGEAADGKDALAKMKVDTFDFVITDWNMPNMDGLTFVQTLRAEKETKTMPILMVTTRSGKGDIGAALKMGVNNYVVKPFTPDSIRDKINQVLANA